MGKNSLIAIPSGMTGSLVGQHMEQGEADGCTARIPAPVLSCHYQSFHLVIGFEI